MIESEELRKDITGLAKDVGLELVEASVSQQHGSIQVRLVVYKREGTGIDECSRLHKLIRPRLEILFGTDDFYMEVASPGIDRTFRSKSEYLVFAGRGACLTLDDGSVVAGIIKRSDETAVVMDTKEGEQSVPHDRIRKGKLDFSQEGK